MDKEQREYAESLVVTMTGIIGTGLVFVKPVTDATIYTAAALAKSAATVVVLHKVGFALLGVAVVGSVYMGIRTYRNRK